MNILTGDRDPQGDSIVIVAGSVSNVGAPSVAGEWNLDATNGKGEHFRGIPSMIHQRKPIFMGYANGKTAVYDPKDALYDKVASDPLTTGGRKTGFLLYVFPKMNFTGVVFKLSCRDVSGNLVTAPDFLMSGPVSDVMPYYPGMTEPEMQ